MIDLIIIIIFSIIGILTLIYGYINHTRQIKLVKQMLGDNKNRLKNLETINKQLMKNVNFNNLNNAYQEAYEEEDKEKSKS